MQYNIHQYIIFFFSVFILPYSSKNTTGHQARQTPHYLSSKI
uniref:Uncharacterized protein n=1 Tax=Arundo donax TaxID=35708 RepID=A0A0A9F6Y3_ARUDO